MSARYTIVHLGILLLVGFGVSIRPTFANSASLRVVDLGYAKYQTDVSLEEGVTSFLGIRYAASVAGKCLSIFFEIYCEGQQCMYYYR